MDGVVNKEREKKLKDQAEKIGVDLILLFGSRALGTNHKDSDFDIAYLSKKPIESFGDIFRPLAVYTGSDNLHITSMCGISPFFLFEITNNCKVLYAKNIMDFYDLRSYAIKRYYDEVKPLYRAKLERLKKEYSI